jgi:hypothetical protein
MNLRVIEEHHHTVSDLDFADVECATYIDDNVDFTVPTNSVKSTLSYTLHAVHKIFYLITVVQLVNYLTELHLKEC